MSSASIVMDIVARDRASRELNNVGDSADRAGRQSHSMGDKMKTAAKVGILALGAGAVIATKLLIDMTKGAIEDQQAQAVLAKQMQNSAHATKGQVAATEDWITAQGKAFGVADDDLRPALGRLVTATHSVGKAQKLASLAMNVSAGTGKSLTTVTAALAKGALGSTAGLSKLGVATKDASGKALTMTQITKKLGEQFGGAAATKAGTLQGKMDRLKLVFDETKETIGAKLIPVVTKLADWFLNKAVPAISSFVSGMQSGKGAGGKFAAVLEAVWSVTKKVFDVISQNKESFGVLAGAIGAVVIATKAWAIGQAALNLVMTANPIGLVVIAIAALVGGVIYAYKNFDTFRAVAKGAFIAIGKAGTWLWNNALQPVLSFIVGGLAKVMGFWAKMLSALSHVPGFGWAKDAADKLSGAANAAQRMADGINKIPDHATKYVDIIIHTQRTGPGGTGGEFPGTGGGAGGGGGGGGSVKGGSGGGASVSRSTTGQRSSNMETLLSKQNDLLSQIVANQKNGIGAGGESYLLTGGF